MKLMVSSQTFRLLQTNAPGAAELAGLLIGAARENTPFEGGRVEVLERAACPPTFAWGHPDLGEIGFLLDLERGRKVNVYFDGDCGLEGGFDSPAEIAFKRALPPDTEAAGLAGYDLMFGGTDAPE